MSAALLNGAATFDLNAARAAAAREATGQPFVFVFGDPPETFEIPSMRQWPLGVQTKIAAGEISDVIAEILGDEQAPRFLANKPTIGDAMLLFEQIAQFSGLGSLGNSSPQQQRASTQT